MTYEDFFTASDIATFKRVKKGQMKLAGICRDVVATLVGGAISERGPEFITTRVGVFRVAMSSNSDNNLERTAHDRMGAETVIIEFDEQIEDFFERHGLDGRNARLALQDVVRARLREEGDSEA